jgi:hypothetical protein
MNFVARQTIAGAECDNSIAERALELFKALEFGFASRQIDQVALHQRRDGRLQFGGAYASPPIGLIVQCNCDILHSYTYMPPQAVLQAFSSRNLVGQDCLNRNI